MDLLLDVAKAVRSAVLPYLGDPATRGAAGIAVGGDVTFGIDEIAEHAAEEVLEAAGDLAWYTEDRGLVVRGNPSRLLIIDPIDGTRPAGAGLEPACVSIAACDYDREATIGDVDEGLILGIKEGTLYRARKNAGVRIIHRGESLPPKLSTMTTIEGAFFTWGIRGRPAVPSSYVLEGVLDGSGVSGGAFDVGSAAFGMVGVTTGRLDAYIDHGQRMVEDVPETRAHFESISGGHVLNNSPYDIAAAQLICREAGVIVTDASGRSLDDKPLVGSGAEYCVSTVAVCTRELHTAIIAALDTGIARLKESI